MMKMVSVKARTQASDKALVNWRLVTVRSSESGSSTATPTSPVHHSRAQLWARKSLSSSCTSSGSTSPRMIK